MSDKIDKYGLGEEVLALIRNQMSFDSHSTTDH